MDYQELGLHRPRISGGEGVDGSEMIAPGYFHKHRVMVTVEEMDH
jgi:hypothetical protein